jgi:hypothetical protein
LESLSERGGFLFANIGERQGVTRKIPDFECLAIDERQLLNTTPYEALGKCTAQRSRTNKQDIRFRQRLRQRATPC